MSRRITYIANIGFPTGKAYGIRGQIAKMCEAFIRNGIRVELITPKLEKTTSEEVAAFYGLSLPPGNLIISPAWVPPISRASRIGFLLSCFVFSITSVLRARRKREIIYSLDLDHFSFITIPFLRRPYFFEIHSNKKDTFFHRRLFKYASGIIAINNNVKNSLEETFPVLKGKIIVHPNGVDHRLYQQTSPLLIQKPAVVYTGSFDDWKGLQVVVGAAEELPDVNFYLVGGKKEALAAGGNMFPPNIFVHGPKPFTEIPKWQNAADILLVTGTKKDEYSYNYTSPLKLFEYMATQKPIVAARTKAIENVVSSDIVFFYEPDDANDLARVIERVFSSTEDVRRKTSAAFEKSKLLSWDARARSITSFIFSKS